MKKILTEQGMGDGGGEGVVSTTPANVTGGIAKYDPLLFRKQKRKEVVRRMFNILNRIRGK